jgi:sortase (surface protein transpeptidase)
MTRNRSIALIAGSLLTLAAILCAWWAWPSGDGRADLTVEPAPATSAPSPRPTTTTTTPPPTPTSTRPAPPPPAPFEPVRVQIPAIGVDTTVVTVALEADGDMELPGAAQVGWYRLGPRPGDPGSAVLAGHVDLGGERGAFFDLRSLPVGAEVVVTGGDGAVRRFVVTSREQVPKAQVDLSRYFTHAGPARITLITCGGAFDRGVGHYQDNIIITATPG